MAKRVVARADEIAPGGRKLFDAGGRDIVIFNVKGEFYALANRCPHKNGELAKGKITGFVSCPEPGQYVYVRQGEVLRCPWHGWEFDIKTGVSWCDPRTMNARAFDVKVESGEELAKGPYVAEKFEVSVEGEYLVIDV